MSKSVTNITLEESCSTPWPSVVWIPAAARSAFTVFDPSEAAFERKYFTIGNLGKKNAYSRTQRNSKNVEMARNNTAKKKRKISKRIFFQ